MSRLHFIILFVLIGINISAQDYETTKLDFTDRTTGWYFMNAGNYDWSLKEGNLCIENQSKQNTIYAVKDILIDFNYDYSIEVKIAMTDGSKTESYGIIWGLYGAKDYMMYQINNKGLASIRLLSKGLEVEFCENKQIKNFLNGQEKPEVLKIKKTKAQLFFYVNNNEVYTCKSPKLIGLGTGFIIGPEQTIEVDYLEYTRWKNEINLVEQSDKAYELENLGASINSKYTEIAPVISPDGRTLFITREHPKNTDGIEDQDIWFSVLNKDHEWLPLKQFDKPLNTKESNAIISVVPDGNAVMVKNKYNEEGVCYANGFSISQKRDGEWQTPVAVEVIEYNNLNDYIGAFWTPDGTKLIIALEDEDSFGDMDLYISFLQNNDTWSKPQNMGSDINTFAAEFSPFLAADGKTLYFASFGHPGYGSADIFLSRRLDDTWLNWSEPQNLGPDINTIGWEGYYTISAKGDYAYVVSGNDEISLGGEDIFRIRIPDSAKPDPVVLVYGKTFNKNTNEPINANILYEDLTAGKEAGKAYSTIEDGYKIALPKGSIYGFRGDAEGFLPVSENIDLVDLGAYTEKEVNLYLIPKAKGQIVRLNNIFFDYDKATLRKESFPELDRLVIIMNENPEMKIEIRGHTDNKGTNEYNIDLSMRRANTVREYLIEHGVDKNRVSAKGYGEEEPVATNDTDEGRQLNRRVEFLIL